MAKEYGEVSYQKFDGITKILDLHHQAMIVLEKKVSQRFNHVEREIRDLKGMVASHCNNFSVPSTSISFEDLISHPLSPDHYELAPPISPIPTSPISTSPSIPSTSPTPPPTLALITVPQSTPSMLLPSIPQIVSPFIQLLPLPISITLPSPPSDTNKKGEKESV
ncbi:proline-rich receptor-like protein kinase PERK2 [Neltuma alba]|uniref:proline-rich receptor-like protein kinase PERK2 n=1 Tax=Neltuma alba TaxID=207710 RepID=UPI0010A2D885|nr:proline-rich receptor-like protein kinase PERK2 [Prosopis alba]